MSINKEQEQREEVFHEEESLQEEEGQPGGEADATQEEMIEERSEEAVLKEELGKEKDKFLRLFAEFENYKKRTTRERMELYKTAGQEVISALLPVLDDFDRAVREIDRSEDSELFKGVTLIQNKFRDTLMGKGLEEIEVQTGDTFDAEIHEAVTQIPAPDKKLQGKVVDVIEKGYKLGDRIIRHPKVVVGK
ncbi:nucleotide exchange factor GrpE [Robiginitalea sp.]|jgi:molecular chaperone GrpE|uniref:nucleotide exchange factor GrpE n=1 Tax=Robiginitalea sp. TaxID=1902411 RepID=UPI003C758ACD